VPRRPSSPKETKPKAVGIRDPRPASQGLAQATLALFFVGAVATQARVQVVQRSEIQAQAIETKRYSVSRADKARRGSILDREGNPIAEDSRATELFIKFEDIPRTDAFFMDLAGATGVPASEFRALADAGVERKSWLMPMSPVQTAAVNRVRRTWRADGVSVAQAGKRDYPLEDAAACLVGTIREFAEVGKEKKPGTVLTGLEATLNEILTGEDGKKVGFTDRQGRFLPTRMLEGEQKLDGDDVRLTIDSDLQRSAYAAVRDAVVENAATDGVAIVIEPETGDILAMANYPSFNPIAGAESDGKNPAGNNPAYMSVFEPGSTFKPLTLAKRADEPGYDYRKPLRCSGTLQLNASWRIRCDLHGGTRAHGMVDGERAMAKSCNVSAATWALEVGYADMVEFIEDIGLLETTGIVGRKEAKGQFNYGEYAKQLQLMNVGFGQSISTTPIALAAAFNTIANGGVRVAPKIVARVGNAEAEPAASKRIFSEQAAAIALESMIAVIQTDAGTGKAFRLPGYVLAGKTGTAQKIGGGTGKGYVSNFVGIVPADKPRATVLVMINDPKKQIYGSQVAGPAFGKIAKSIIRRYQIPPSQPSESNGRIAMATRGGRD